MRRLAHTAFGRFLVVFMLSGALSAQHNVCVVVIDDCGPELIGAFDQHFATLGKPSGTPAATPAIDQLLAARGVMFTRAWSAPVCTPTRAQMLTGRYARRTGVGSTLLPRDITQQPGLDESFAILPEFLKSAPLAYTRAAIGKWHLASTLQLESSVTHPLGAPTGRWFDHFAGHLLNLQKPDDLPANASVYSNWVKFGATEQYPWSLPCDALDAPCFVDVFEGNVSSYATVDTTNEALKMLKVLREPWFMWVGYGAIHAPTHNVPAGLPLAECAGYQPQSAVCDPGPNPSKAQQARCMLEALDTQLARLLCAIDDTDTTVVFLSDNGSTGNYTMDPYPSDHGKGTVYEGGVHVPMIVRSPLIPSTLAGTTCDSMVNTLDVFATVCDLALVAPEIAAATDSISFLPHLLGPAPAQRTNNYTELFKPNFTPDPSTGSPPTNYVASRHDQAITDGRFKLIRKVRRSHAVITTTQEFYDLLEGGPLDMHTVPPSPTPDFFEQFELLAAGVPLTAQASAAFDLLSATLDTVYPNFVR